MPGKKSQPNDHWADAQEAATDSLCVLFGDVDHLYIRCTDCNGQCFRLKLECNGRGRVPSVSWIESLPIDKGKERSVDARRAGDE